VTCSSFMMTQNILRYYSDQVEGICPVMRNSLKALHTGVFNATAFEIYLLIKMLLLLVNRFHILKLLETHGRKVSCYS